MVRIHPGDRRIRILHVDDDPDFAAVSATFVEREDDRFTVETVTSATEGLDRLAEGEFECVVSDYDMPGQNGLELLKTVRQDHPNIPFILFTGKGSEEVASEAISAGVTDYLQKQTGAEQYELLATRIDTAVGQYRAEQELDRKNDLFNKVQTLADIGAWEWNREKQDGYYSTNVYEIYETDSQHDPSPEKDLMQFYHPDDRNQLRAALETAVEAGDPYDIEVRIHSDDGTEKWVRTSGDPQFEDGRCVRIRGTIQDITERKEREQELESEQAFIEQSLNTLNDIFYFVDTEGNFQRWNETLPELTSYTDEEIASMNALEFFEGVHQKSIEDAIKDILQTGSNVTEAEITTKDGRQIPHEFRGVRMTDETGTPTGIIGIARDITERKTREQQLTERKNELMAERDRLDEFVSVVSHDLRNPLNVATLRLELAREQSEIEDLDAVAGALDRMDTLIDDLLLLARNGKQRGELEQINLNNIVTRSWENVETKDATFVIETDGTLYADRNRLQQLFENLFRNAVEHGGDDVVVTIGALNDGLSVEDDGSGIPHTEQTTVFEAGYSTAQENTGFGLSIVKQIVDSHGWDICMTDGSQGGARFEITDLEFVPA